MNWLIDGLQKEARRFQPGHKARYYSRPNLGKGQGIVHQPSFSRGQVVRYDPNIRRYIVVDDKSGDEVQVHPRNMVPDSINSSPDSNMSEPTMTEPTMIEPMNMETDLQ